MTCFFKPSTISLSVILLFMAVSTDIFAQAPAPDLPITLLNGAKTNANRLKGNIVLVMFQPDCDHCQREAEQISAHLQAFKKYTLYFISSASPPEISNFAKEYRLQKPGIVFGRAEGNDVLKAFGPIEAPSLYIYVDGKEVQSFNGEVAIEVVIKYL
jgi:peroxiredoxin